jgi:hypothetical protein
MTSRVLAGLLVLFEVTACAHSAPPAAQPYSRSADTPSFTADGRVLAVENDLAGNRLTYVRLVISDGDPPLRVELAPGWYLDQQGLRFSKDDRVTIEGTKVEQDGKSVVVARSVRTDNQTVILRDEEGRPRWPE